MKRLIISFLRTFRNFLKEQRYFLKHRREATSVLKFKEKESGKTLSNEGKRQVKKYAKKTFGSIQYAPWLYVYSISRGGGVERFIPDDYYGLRLVPKLKGNYGKVAELKALNSFFIDKSFLPDIASYINGLFFNTSYQPIAEKDLKEELFKNTDKIVYKLDNSEQGKGIHIFTSDTFSIQTIKTIGNGLFQTYIKQHAFFEQFTKKSTATIRLTTFSRTNGEVELLAAYLRLARDKDNYVKSKSAIKVSINTTDGTLYNTAHLADWTSVTEHPDTNISFSGKTIPFWEETVKAVKNMHGHLLFVRCIGWDVILDKNNDLKVIEWNGMHNDIKYSEATQGPIFAKVIDELDF